MDDEEEFIQLNLSSRPRREERRKQRERDRLEREMEREREREAGAVGARGCGWADEQGRSEQAAKASCFARL